MKTLNCLIGALAIALFAIGCANDTKPITEGKKENGTSGKTTQVLNRDIKIEKEGQRVTLSVPAMT